MRDALDWSIHTEATEPADFRAEIERLPDDVAALGRSVQRLLVHTDCLALYGLDPASRVDVDRTTLPVRERLGRLAALSRLDLAEGRPPAGRAVGTCRDFALLLCSFLRAHGTAARVRCGFASYFGAGWWDHWICEHRGRGTSAWLRADAGLDEAVCEACGITFDPTHMPEGAFLAAGEAWLECRAGRLSPDSFGHGEHRGLWFMAVDVVRDSLSLNGREMSPWDSWRLAPPEARRLSADQVLCVDGLARRPGRRSVSSAPPWLRPDAAPAGPG